MTTLGYNTSGQLTSITDADSTVWDYGYDSAARLTSITDPLTNADGLHLWYRRACLGRDAGRQLDGEPDASPGGGLPATGTGTSTTPATAYLATEVQATYTDPNGENWLTRFDWVGYGVVTQATDPLGNETVIYRKDCGCPWLMTDPLGQITPHLRRQSDERHRGSATRRLDRAGDVQQPGRAAHADGRHRRASPPTPTIPTAIC